MIYAITAATRTNMGKRSKDELKEMRIPAVIYGKGVEARSIAVPRSEFIKLYKAAGFSSLIDIAMEGQTTVKAVIKEVQLHPITNEITHIDLHQIRMDEKMTAKIPLKFVGESAAVKAEGGTLVKSMDEIEIMCLPANLPHEIEVDLSKIATFEDSITIGSLALPAGVETTDDANATIATVSRPLTEDELKKLEESMIGDVTAVKTETEEKRAEAAKKEEEEKKAAE